MWLSLVERLTGGQEVVGSNPAIPIFSGIIFRFLHTMCLLESNFQEALCCLEGAHGYTQKNTCQISKFDRCFVF